MRNGSSNRRAGDPLKGMAAGAIGGLVAAFVMNQTSSAIQVLPQSWNKERIALAGQQGGQHNYPEKYGSEEQESEDATQRAADKLAQTVLHHPLSKQKKKIAGPIVHYAFGAAVGAAYGALAERLPVNKVAGVPFGAAVWLGADEIAVPAAGLSGPPPRISDFHTSERACRSHRLWCDHGTAAPRGPLGDLRARHVGEAIRDLAALDRVDALCPQMRSQGLIRNSPHPEG